METYKIEKYIKVIKPIRLQEGSRKHKIFETLKKLKETESFLIPFTDYIGVKDISKSDVKLQFAGSIKTIIKQYTELHSLPKDTFFYCNFG